MERIAMWEVMEENDGARYERKAFYVEWDKDMPNSYKKSSKPKSTAMNAVAPPPPRDQMTSTMRKLVLVLSD
jgi:hypothetical protein